MTMYTGRSPNASTPTIINGRGLKKRKLSLKDRISFIEDQLTPDIIA